MTKPVSAYIAGVTAPAGKKMGHAGAIVSGGKGTAAAKMEALTAAGVKVGRNPTEAGELMVEIVKSLAQPIVPVSYPSHRDGGEHRRQSEHEEHQPGVAELVAFATPQRVGDVARDTATPITLPMAPIHVRNRRRPFATAPITRPASNAITPAIHG